MTAAEDWNASNQRALSAAVRRVRARVEAARDGTGVPPSAGAEEWAALDGTALARVCRAFELTRFERDLLLLCAGPELDGSFGAVPSFGLALAALPDPHWSALLPQAPLRGWRLIRMAPDAPLCEARLRIEECVLHALAGLPCADERLRFLVEALPDGDPLPPSQDDVALRVSAALVRGALPLLIGPAGEISPVAAAAAARLGLRLGAADANAVAANAENWLATWERDARLAPAALLVRCEADMPGDLRGGFAAALRGLRTPVLLAASRAPDLPGLLPVGFPVGRPTRDEQAGLWRAALAPAPEDPGAEAAIERVVTHFDLGARAIAAAGRGADGMAGRIWAACREAAAAVGSEGAPARTAAASWADLAVPPAEEALLRAVVAQARHRRIVHDRWGFGAQSTGVSALFHGPSGTGKSLAAAVLAGELGLDLHAIDLSRVVSKYIGDTERHLRAAFEAAEASGAVLLFDEADALFGSRSEVRDSHDRYANIEVSYLLQRMERFAGLAVLTTNMKDSIDSAFLRRIRFLVEFRHPGPAGRARLWRRALPQTAPQEAIDLSRLAQASFTGAQIGNVALAAAFLAAEAGRPVGMAHLLEAARRECAKLGRPLTQAEIAGWV